MKYDPFNRGEYPVGVRTIELINEPLTGRNIMVEMWYPATGENKGKDTNEATKDRFVLLPGVPEIVQEAVRDAEQLPQKFPLILNFHGGYGDRREVAHVCSHLASHGYVVASPAFPGDNVADLALTESLSETEGGETKVSEPIDKSATNRPHQAVFVLDSLLSDPEQASFIDTNQIGTFGVSMGGFTALRLNSIDSRTKAAIPIAPLWGMSGQVPQIKRLQQQVRVDDWNRPVPTFLIAGEADAIIILKDLRRLAGELRAPKRFAVLGKAGHNHWANGAEQVHELFRMSYLSGNFADPEIDAKALGEAMRPFAELCPADHAADTLRALCLAHFDENLKRNGAAKEFLDNDLAETFASRGIDLEVAS